MKVSEQCMCGSRFSVTLQSDVSGYANWLDLIMEKTQEWRERHPHAILEPESLPEDPPTVIESSSSHERSYEPQDDAEARSPRSQRIGFQSNPSR